MERIIATIGLDIGGANLKAADSLGQARTLPFALWKEPRRLPDMLRTLLASLPYAETLAVTMTGELCDCFASKAEGVAAILASVREIAGPRRVAVWTVPGRFVDLAQACREPLTAAAANWLALATCAAKLIAPRPGLLIDIGSTTTDIIPLLAGQARPSGLSDPDRMRSRELIYCGARRTPVCALLGLSVAAEWFATTLDVYLMLDMIREDPSDHDTADGRAATPQAAHARLAHLLCGDASTISTDETRRLAENAMQTQVNALVAALQHVAGQMLEPPVSLVLAGSGEFLARHVVQTYLTQHAKTADASIISLADRWGPELSQAACAFAVAQLASDPAAF